MLFKLRKQILRQKHFFPPRLDKERRHIIASAISPPPARLRPHSPEMPSESRKNRVPDVFRYGGPDQLVPSFKVTMRSSSFQVHPRPDRDRTPAAMMDTPPLHRQRVRHEICTEPTEVRARVDTAGKTRIPAVRLDQPVYIDSRCFVFLRFQRRNEPIRRKHES